MDGLLGYLYPHTRGTSNFHLCSRLVLGLDHRVGGRIELLVSLMSSESDKPEDFCMLTPGRRTFRNGSPTTKRYSTVLPPRREMSWPAPAAEPPVAMRSLEQTPSYQRRAGKASTLRQHSLDHDADLTWLDSVAVHLKLVLKRERLALAGSIPDT